MKFLKLFIAIIYSKDKFKIIKYNAKWNTITQSFRNNCEYNSINQIILSKDLSNLSTTKQPYVSTSILQNKLRNILLWHTVYNLYAIIYRFNISSAKNIDYFNSINPIAISQNLLIIFTSNYNLYATIYRLNISSAKNIDYFFTLSLIFNIQNSFIIFIINYKYNNTIDQRFKPNCIIWIIHMKNTQLICNESITRNSYKKDCFVDNRVIFTFNFYIYSMAEGKGFEPLLREIT
jgi:hypothetical protein